MTPSHTTHDDYLEWAASKVEPLRGRAAEAEQLRELPAATIADADQAELWGMVVPRHLGGAGLGLSTLAETTRVLAHGCVSSSWTLSFLAMHNWFIARGSRQLQTAVFGDHGFARMPCALAPTGVARPVDGGYVVTGTWEWATGVQHADWVMVHAIVERDDVLETRFAVVPIDEVTVDDVWHTSGMRGTGSNTIVADAVFVPTERTIFGGDFRNAPADDAEPGSDPFVRYPITPVLTLVAAGSALGGAEAAVEHFRERQASRVLAYSLGDRQIEQPAAQIRLAEALATVRAAGVVWRDAIDRVIEGALDGSADDPVTRAGFRLAAAHVVRLSVQTLETVLEGSGASVHFEDSPVQRIARDLLTLRGHVVFDWDRTAQLVGKIELGIEPSPTDML